MTVAAFVISVLALLASGGAVWYARQQAAAARRSARADERAVELAEVAAAKYAPPWVVRWETGSRYQVRNDGDEAVHDVEITLDGVRLARGELQHSSISARSAVAFIASRTRADGTVTVTWARLPGGEQYSWKHPFPARPS